MIVLEITVLDEEYQTWRNEHLCTNVLDHVFAENFTGFCVVLQIEKALKIIRKNESLARYLSEFGSWLELTRKNRSAIDVT